MSAPLARRLLALRLNGLVSLEGSCSQSPANLPCAAHRAGIACIRCGTQPSLTRTVLLSLFPVAGSGSAAQWPKAAPEHKRHVWVNDARAQLGDFGVAIIDSLWLAMSRSSKHRPPRAAHLVDRRAVGPVLLRRHAIRSAWLTHSSCAINKGICLVKGACGSVPGPSLFSHACHAGPWAKADSIRRRQTINRTQSNPRLMRQGCGLFSPPAWPLHSASSCPAVNPCTTHRTTSPIRHTGDVSSHAAQQRAQSSAP